MCAVYSVRDCICAYIIMPKDNKLLLFKEYILRKRKEKKVRKIQNMNYKELIKEIKKRNERKKRTENEK